MRSRSRVMVRGSRRGPRDLRGLRCGGIVAPLAAPPHRLVERNPIARAVAEGVAPGNPWLGVMLPYTPLHHLLLRELDGIPLVMTSGNRSDEPIAYDDR